MNSPMDMMAALRGHADHAAYAETKLAPAATQAVPQGAASFTLEDVAVIVRHAIEPLVKRMDALETKLADMTSNNSAVSTAMLAGLAKQIARTEAEVIGLRADHGATIRPGHELPPLDQITKIQLQYWDNQLNPPAPRYDAKGKRLKSTLPNNLFKLYVWTCPPDEIHTRARGSCREMWVPVYPPNSARSRKRLGDKLDYLEVTPGDGIKWYGCLTTSIDQRSKQYPDQAIVVHEDGRLYMSIRGEAISCGMPKFTTDDAEQHAPLCSWYWETQLGPVTAPTDGDGEATPSVADPA